MKDDECPLCAAEDERAKQRCHQCGRTTVDRVAALEKERDAALARVGEWLAAMPKCIGAWVSGSGGHAMFSRDCPLPAAWHDEGGSSEWRFCDWHCPEHLKNNGKINEVEEYPWAHLIRAATGGATSQVSANVSPCSRNDRNDPE